MDSPVRYSERHVGRMTKHFKYESFCVWHVWLVFKLWNPVHANLVI